MPVTPTPLAGLGCGTARLTETILLTPGNLAAVATARSATSAIRRGAPKDHAHPRSMPCGTIRCRFCCLQRLPHDFAWQRSSPTTAPGRPAFPRGLRRVALVAMGYPPETSPYVAPPREARCSHLEGPASSRTRDVHDKLLPGLVLPARSVA